MQEGHVKENVEKIEKRMSLSLQSSAAPLNKRPSQRTEKKGLITGNLVEERSAIPEEEEKREEAFEHQRIIYFYLLKHNGNILKGPTQNLPIHGLEELGSQILITESINLAELGPETKLASQEVGRSSLTMVDFEQKPRFSLESNTINLPKELGYERKFEAFPTFLPSSLNFQDKTKLLIERFSQKAKAYGRKDKEFPLEADKKKARLSRRSLGPNLEIIKYSLKKIDQDRRLEFLKELCDDFQREAPVPQILKLENRMSADPLSVEMIEVLEKKECPPEFFETTTRLDMGKILSQIENITGFDLITKKSSLIRRIKLESPVLDNQLGLLNDLEQLKNSFLYDICSIYKVASFEVRIRNVLSEGREFLFSIPEVKQPSELSLSCLNFPSLSVLLFRHGVAHFEVKEQWILPDPQKAQEIFKSYTSPTVLNTRNVESPAMRKIGDCIPLLASLNPQIKSNFNAEEGSLKLFGPHSSKAEFQYLLMKIDRILYGIPPPKINIITQPEYQPSLGNLELWDILYQKAKAIALEYINEINPIQTHSLKINTNLKAGSPAASKFVSGLKSLGFNPEWDYNSIAKAGVFAWHGTSSAQAVLDIAVNSVNPKLRKWQLYGPGEYFGEFAQISQSYWGNTNTLFLFFILQKDNFNQDLKAFSYHRQFSTYIINNPTDQNLLYCVPILIATFNYATPLKIDGEFRINVKEHAVWEWLDDDFSWKKYGVGQTSEHEIQFKIEEMHQKFSHNPIIYGSITLQLIRLRDYLTDSYTLDFKNMVQINDRTRWERKIRRRDPFLF